MNDVHLYFHQDFDGVVCGALLWSFFEHISRPVAGLHPVAGTTPAWRRSHLKRPATVADLRRHPEADLWFDHHQAPDDAPPPRPSDFWEPGAASCAGVVFRALAVHRGHREDRFAPLVEAADRIDTSDFQNPGVLVACESPWLRLSLIVQTTRSSRRVREAVRRLAEDDREGADHLLQRPGFRADLEAALDRQRHQATTLAEARRVCEGRVLVYDHLDYAFHKYLPFAVARDVELAIGVTRDTAMERLIVCKNPWRPSQALKALDVGLLCRREGGGGHFDRGGVPLPAPAHKLEIRNRILDRVRDAISTQPPT